MRRIFHRRLVFDSLSVSTHSFSIIAHAQNKNKPLVALVLVIGEHLDHAIGPDPLRAVPGAMWLSASERVVVTCLPERATPLLLRFTLKSHTNEDTDVFQKQWICTGR